MFDDILIYVRKSDTDKAYIAGLFDGEGSIHFKRGWRRKRNTKVKKYRMSNSLRLSMEITMTDRSVLMWVHEVLIGVGTLTKKPRKGKRVDGTPISKIETTCNGDGDV